MKRIILYHNNLLKFGGVDTFVYNFVKKMSKFYDILFLYTTANAENLERIKKYVETEQYNKDKKYVCDVCICASAWGQYPETVVAKSGRYIQMVHADYIRANGKEIEYNEYGEAKIKQDDFYLINNTERAETIKKSGLAEVKMITKTKGRKE